MYTQVELNLSFLIGFPLSACKNDRVFSPVYDHAHVSDHAFGRPLRDNSDSSGHLKAGKRITSANLEKGSTTHLLHRYSLAKEDFEFL